VRFAWTLRDGCRTPRGVRELLILRGAQLFGSEYEWTHHVRMARAAGVTEEQLEELARWRESGAFTPPERAALALAEASMEGPVPDEVDAELARHFDDAERVELALTAAFYAMVPRVLEALRVPLEEP
jgi:alkylhydroperoxidase family enzyme